MATRGQRAAQWREDLAYLASQLELRHPNLYHQLSRERFRDGLDEIEARLPSLTDDGVVLALARLLARVGDGHTLVPLLWDDTLGFRRLPVQLVRTYDGLSVLAADTSLASIVGERVVQIGSLPAVQVLDSVSTLISYDNAWTTFQDAATYATIPEILYGLGITASSDRVRLVLEDASGGRRDLTIDAIDRDVLVRWDYGAFDGTAPWLARRDDPYWLTALPGDSVLYVQFNRADRDKEDESLAAFGRRLLAMVKDGAVRRIVVDLRWNHGGARWRARHLLGALIAAEFAMGSPRDSRARRPDGHLVTLIGPETFSAANLFALDLDLHTNTAFVGMPTGGKPNHYGEVGRFRLPHSRMEIRHSVYYRQADHPRDTRPAIFPDQRVAWTTRDVFDGRDPAFEAAVAWKPLPSGRETFERIIREEGPDVARRWLDTLATDPSPAVRITEGDLNRLGYAFLQEGDAATAARVFSWNREAHPWSANTYDSLADAYLALGRQDEAEHLLCQALAIDPQFNRSLDRGVDCR